MYQSRRAGERETRQKSVSLPPKAGELASLLYGNQNNNSLTIKLTDNNKLTSVLLYLVNFSYWFFMGDFYTVQIIF